MSTAIGRWPIMVIDCPDPHTLALFYSAVTGWPVIGEEDSEWVQLDSSHTSTIGFQRVNGYRAPQWPGQDVPQQAHLDFTVDNLADAEYLVLGLGAVKAPVQPGESWRVFLDPAGHPFCLVQATSEQMS
ncbi:MAG: glyoxalase [Actinobacteria bacterium HGW-Actinobacteria-2]|nr:MAG: glyoxalase [Actinobacteria bacterium HGW-Actinobacteria-2]